MMAENEHCGSTSRALLVQDVNKLVLDQLFHTVSSGLMHKPVHQLLTNGVNGVNENSV